MRKEIEAGTAPHSFGRDFVQSNYRAQGLDELDAAYTAYDPLDRPSGLYWFLVFCFYLGFSAVFRLLPTTLEFLFQQFTA